MATYTKHALQFVAHISAIHTPTFIRQQQCQPRKATDKLGYGVMLRDISALG